MGKVTAEEMQGLMYGNSNNTARSDGSSPKMVSASDMENLMAPYRSQEIKHTVLSPGMQPAQAAPAGASSRKQSETMKQNVDTLKKQRDDALIKAGAYSRAGNMQQQAKEQQKIANKAAIEYENAYTQWKNQRNAEAVEDYNPDENKFKVGDAALSGVQNAFQSMRQYAAAASSYLSGNPEAQAWEAKRLMDSGVSGTEAVKRAGLADKREIPITDYKTQAELRHEKNVASVGAVEGGALQLVNTISNMVPSLVANAVLPGSGLPMMAASAAGNKYVDAYEKYGNTDMAFALGSAAGAASMLTEQLGGVYGKMGGTKLGQAVSKKLMSEAPGLYNLANSVGGKWLRDALSEGIEEGAEDVINYAIEKALTGDSDEMDNFGYDILLGALAGGVLGGGNAAMRSITYSRVGKALNASPAAVAQQVQEGMEKGAGTAPAIYAAEVQKNPSNQMVGRLYEANLTYDAESGLSKIQNDITQVSINEIKAMVSKADALAQAAQKLNVEATPQSVATAITDAQRTQSIKTAEDSVGQAFAPTVDNPANAGEKAYNSALAGVAANQGVAARINNDPAARQAFSQLTGVQFSGNTAQDIAAIEVATQNIAKSGKQAISQAEYAQRVAAAGEQAAAQFDADMQAQAEQMQRESDERWLSVEQNTIADVDGKRRIKEITNTDVRGNTEIGYKKAEILGSKKKAVAEVNNAAKYLGKTIVWFEGAVQVNGQYRLTNGYRAPDGTIYVNINSRDPLMVTFGHEMFHDLVSDGKYGGMIDTLVESPEYAATIKVELEHKEELYRANGIELTADEAAEEVAADICGSILGSKSMLEYIGARNAETATGIKGWLDRILNKLKGKPTAQEAYERLSESQRALIDGMEVRDEDGNLLGYSKKEANRLLHRDGLQLPRRNTAVDFDTINVPQDTDVVNTHSMQTGEKNAQEKLSLMEMPMTDSTGRELSAEQQEYFKDSKVRDADGRLMPLYHQTSEEFTVFDTRHKGAGTGDNETPFGVFLKSSSNDIGVNGSRQMELYADIKNPLQVRDRSELVSRLVEMSPEYTALKNRSDAIDKEYSQKFEKAKKDFVDFITEWRRQNPDAPRSALYEVDEFNKVFDAEDSIVEEWGKAKDDVALQAKEAITSALRNNGYDGVIISRDAGSFGRTTDAYIALDARQVKNIDNLTPTGSKDIRYSLMRTKSGENFVMVENPMTKAQLNDPKAIANYIASHIGEMYTIIESGQKVYIGEDLPNEYTRSKYSQSIIQGGKKKAKNKAVSNLGEMVEIATNRRWEKTRHSQNKDAAYGMYRYDTTFAFPVKGTTDTYRAYDAEIVIRNASDGKKYLYDIVGIKENTGLVLDLNQKARGRQYAAAQSGASNNSLPQTESAVNTHSMQDSQNDAQGDYSLMDTLPQEKYFADLDQAVAEATAKSEEALKAAQTEVKNIRQQLADYRQQATAEAKNTAAWKDGEAKLIADLSEAQSKEKKARALASYMDEYNAISERYRGEARATDTEALTQYNEKLSNLRSGFRGEMEKLAIEQGAFKRGEKAARDIYVPTSVNGQKVTRGTRTILEASQTPDSMLEEHAKEILAGARGYEVISDKKAQEYAERIIDKEGYDKADELFTNAVNGDQVLDKKTLVLGEYLYMEAAKAGDVKNAMRYAADVAAAATRAGQVVQAMRVLKKATPTGKLYYLNRMVDTMNKNIVDNGGDPILIDEGLARKLLEAENIKDPKEQGKAVDETIDEIEQNIADQIPATAWDKWNAWRYLSMLGNIRTQVRNVVGNAAFMPLVATKNLLAAGLEKAFIRNGGRTKSAFFTKTNVGKRLMEFGKKDFDTVVDEIQGGGKYNQSSSIEEKRTIFKSKAIEGWRKLTNKAMDKGDEIFSKHHYARALAGYLYANHLDYDKITRNTPQAQEVLNKARAYAILEAQKATFRDANQFASFINKIKRNLLKKAQTAETKGAKAGWYVGTALAEGVMPFTKTPIDIAVRGIEYSPIGLIKGIKEAVYDVKKGNKTAAEAIDTLSAGLTGTGIFALGYFLQSLGFLAGALGSDKDEKYKKDSGAQGFALHIGDKYYTIDWLAPFSLPLFTGAAVAETVENGDEVSFATLADALSTISEPMLEMSMLQGLNAALSSGKYGDEAAIASFVTTNGFSYLAQANPTILGQIARAVDDTSRNAYYYDPNYKGFVKQVKVFVDKQLAKVPFASKVLTSRIDLWGNKQENTGGSFFGRLAYNMLSPGYYSEESNDPVDVALTKLYEETEDTAVLPSKPRKTVTNNKTDYKMNAKQYEEYCIVKGQTAHKEIQTFINSAEYKKMSNEDRVDVLEHLYKYSTYKAQKNLLGDKYVASSTYSLCVKAEAYAKGGNQVYKYFLKG